MTPQSTLDLEDAYQDIATLTHTHLLLPALAECPVHSSSQPSLAPFVYSLCLLSLSALSACYQSTQVSSRHAYRYITLWTTLFAEVDINDSA